VAGLVARQWAAALAAAASVCPGVAAQQPMRPASMRVGEGVQRFVFDGAFRGTAGMKFRVERPVATVNPLGEAVAPNAPRFAAESAIAGAPVFELVRASASPITVVGSGLDHDGVTPLLVTYEAVPAGPILDVFSVEGAALVSAQTTGIGRVRTVLPATGDLMRGAVAGKRYRVTSGVVCHGLIVIFCTVEALNAGAWRDSANAFVVSQDRGATWAVAYESTAFFPGPARGAPWTMQNWWPMKRDPSPTEAYFAATDYCANPGAPGGRLYVMKAQRARAGMAWSIKQGTVAFEVSGNSSEHMHIGGVVPFGETGVRAFAALGDGRTNNRIVSLVNRQGDYTGAWEIDGAYHGARGTPGVEGNQFVGCAPGPFAGTVLAGADLTVEQLTLLTMDPLLAHPVTDRVAGYTASDGLSNVAFIVRTPTPELGGPYVASTEPFFFLPQPYVKRALYSPDGMHWAQAAAPPGGYPVLHGGHIYFDGAAGTGLLRVPVPEVVAGRPLVVGPGGIQHSRTDAAVSATPASRFVALTRDALGQWVDEGRVLDPQPPTKGTVYRVRTSSNDASPVIARVYPAGPQNGVNRVLGSQLQVNAWVMHTDPSRSATLQIGYGDSVQAPVAYRTVNLSSTHAWAPVTACENIDIAPGRTLQMFVRCSGEVCNDQTMYLALDSVVEGAGTPGYPMPQDASVPAAGTPMPDEVATVSGFACGKAWTITLALQIPEDGFDFRSALQENWPLATLWGNDANSVQLWANTRTGQVTARVIVEGRLSRTLASDAITMVRGAPILVSIAQPAGLGATEMTVSAAGQQVHTRAMGFVSSPRLAVQPREIRFGAVPSLPTWSGRGAAVSPLLVWGGQIEQTRAMSRVEREQLLKRLRFLTLALP
jgi:hypothetical protein